EHRYVDLLRALPNAARAGHRALQERGLDPLAGTGDLARPQRCADRGAGGEEGAQARPVGRRVQWARARSALEPLVGNLEVSVRVADTCHMVDGPLGPAALFPLQAGACGHERVIPGAV